MRIVRGVMVSVLVFVATLAAWNARVSSSGLQAPPPPADLRQHLPAATGSAIEELLVRFDERAAIVAWAGDAEARLGAGR